MPDLREKLIELRRVCEALVNTFCDCQKDCNKCQYYQHGCQEGFIAEYLINQGIISQGWTPVTVDLPYFYPGKRRKLLVTMEDKNGRRLVTTAKYDEASGVWYDFTDWRYLKFKVLAWMPRPDAYDPEVDDHGRRP